MLVISDLHAFDGINDDSAPSMFHFSGTGGTAVEMLDSCTKIVQDQFSSVDAILVAGDITNHAQESALQLTWARLQTSANDLGAKLIATAGNHDYDSRGNSGADPKGALISLEPPFPAGAEDLRRDYFAYDFAVVVEKDYLVVILNSAAQHGYSFGERHEYDHGRVLKRTISRIADFLDSLPKLPTVRILLVHHHVEQLPDLDTEEQSILTDAMPLLRMLAERGDWVVVHGHKHRAWMQYAGGGGDAPVVFSAGSFAANFGVGAFSASVRKQFYVIEFNTRPMSGLGVAGRVLAWTFNGFGWVEANENDGYPGVSGFGWRASTEGVASDLHSFVAKNRKADSSELLQREPRLQYLVPDDERKVLRKLRDRSPSVHTTKDSRGIITEMYVREESDD